MNKKISQYAERRNDLIAKAAAQRADFAAAYAPVQNTLNYLDYGYSAIRSVGRHPVLAGSIAAIVVFMMPKRWKIVLFENLLPAGFLLLRKYLVKK